MCSRTLFDFIIFGWAVKLSIKDVQTSASVIVVVVVDNEERDDELGDYRTR